MSVKKTFGFIHEYMKYFLYHENRRQMNEKTKYNNEIANVPLHAFAILMQSLVEKKSIHTTNFNCMYV